MTLFLAFFIVCASLLLIAFLFKIWRLVNQSLPHEKLDALGRLDAVTLRMEELQRTVGDLQAQLGRDSAFQSNLGRILGEVEKASQEVATLKGERQADLREFKGQLSRVNDQLGSVTSTLLGRKSGSAGENILREALRVFPPEWVRSPYYDVEFGLVLFDRRVIPVDSKFAAAELLERYGQVESDNQRFAIAQQIEKQLLTRAREVAKYIVANSTTTGAICAVPASVYGLLRNAHIQSYNDYRVIIMPYSMTVPYLLSLYDLHLKYIGQIDESRLEAFISSMEQAVKALKDALENKVKDANTRLGNAYRDCVQAVSTIEGSLTALKSHRVQSLQPEEATTGKEVVG